MPLNSLPFSHTDLFVRQVAIFVIPGSKVAPAARGAQTRAGHQARVDAHVRVAWPRTAHHNLATSPREPSKRSLAMSNAVRFPGRRGVPVRRDCVRHPHGVCVCPIPAIAGVGYCAIPHPLLRKGWGTRKRLRLRRGIALRWPIAKYAWPCHSESRCRNLSAPGGPSPQPGEDVAFSPPMLSMRSNPAWPPVYPSAAS